MILPNLENLRCFLAAAEHLNFRRAASGVALTPNAFGQRIKQLEEQVGAPLFERTTRRVRLTRAGLSLVPEARAALDQARRCVEVVQSGGAPPARFTLGTRFELGNSWLVPLVVGLRDREPTWTIELYFGAGPDILDRMLIGEVDAVITSAPWARAGWTQHVIHVETYVLVAAPELLERLPLNHAEDARAHTVMDVDRTLPLTRYVTDSVGPPLEWGDIRIVGAGAAMLALARAGHGICVLPTYMCADDLQSGRLVACFEDRVPLSDTFRLIHRADAPLTDAYDRLAGYLRAEPLR